jgi:hypothetical protein
VVRLPSGLAYVEDSARLFSGMELEEARLRTPDQVEECPNGDSFVYFDLNERELEDHGPDPYNTGEEQKLDFEVTAVSVNENAVFQATAGHDLVYSCTRNMVAEQSETAQTS